MKKLQLDSSSMTRLRKQVGQRGFEAMLREMIAAALMMKCIKEKDLEKAVIDTTVQEKNTTFPTDLKLYAKGVELLVREAKREGIELRQSNTCVIPKLERQSWLHARG